MTGEVVSVNLLLFPKSKGMEIQHFTLGDFETNCYVLRKNTDARLAATRAAECLVIDAGLDPGNLIEFLRQNKLHIASVILTHGHADHIAGLHFLRGIQKNLKVCIHKLDAEIMNDPQKNLSLLTGFPFTASADCTLNDQDLVELAGIELKVIHTPGHTPGGISLYSKNDGILFSGDTLFADSVGRTDFPEGNRNDLIESIKKKLLILPDETVVYPGHGPVTTIGKEKQTNPFIR